LFRPSDVGKLKSKAAATAVQVMNPAIRIDAQALRVSNETEDVYVII
jgi:molybdopterin/thiamine biosynthesis adenylyltransferase